MMKTPVGWLLFVTDAVSVMLLFVRRAGLEGKDIV
jgi:hypothetical protein